MTGFPGVGEDDGGESIGDASSVLDNGFVDRGDDAAGDRIRAGKLTRALST